MASRYKHIIDKIIEKLKENNINISSDLIYEAFEYADEKHKGEFRRSGAPYIEHPVMVADILSDIRVDDKTIAAALLHDVVEDTDATKSVIREKFGNDVAEIVEGVTKINDIFHSYEHKRAENYRKLGISSIKDFRVIIIKFADRLHNMRTLKYLSPEKQNRIATETLEIFAPLANRLGIYKIKNELEDRALQIINPINYENISQMLEYSKKEMEDVIEKVKPIIEKRLDEIGIRAEINGRVKHHYSILKKLQTRKKSFDEIYDLMAVRVILEDELCYKVLEVVHNLFKPVPGMFNDYIARPKPNNYRSLHTKVIFERKIIEIQIRTRQMHEYAEYGLAAHWRYKQNKNTQNDVIDDYIDRLRAVLDNSFESSDPHEVIEELKLNLIPSEILVFTPKKDPVTLPHGSTPVDFAYKIHENIGNHCIAAKVSGKLVPISTELKDGDIVEIITSKNQTPSFDWLKFVKYSKARQAIKHYLKKAQYEQSVTLGKEIINSEFTKYKIKMVDEVVEDLANSFGYNEIDKFYQTIGSGNITPTQFLRKIIPEYTSEQKSTFFGKIVNVLKSSKQGLKIHNDENTKIKFATCCHPLPGDAIKGILVPDEGISVHRINCKNIEEIDSENFIEVTWDTDKDERFCVEIKIISEDRQSLLFDIAKILNKMNINMTKFDMSLQDALVICTFVAEMKNLSHYTKLRKKLQSISGVIRVGRNI